MLMVELVRDRLHVISSKDSIITPQHMDAEEEAPPAP
jgi:hypothetical protein